MNTKKTTYPTDEAWNFFMLHHDAIRAVCERFLPVPKMEVPNTRVAITTSDGREMVTEQRASVPLPVSNTLADFDAAVKAKDTLSRKGLVEIMNSAWLRAPEDRRVYSIPGFTEMCNLLDCTVDGFFDSNGPADDDLGDDTSPASAPPPPVDDTDYGPF